MALEVGAFSWRRDPGWDKPMVDTKDRERYAEIDKWLYYPGLLCRIAGDAYMFLDTSNYWTNLSSREAMSRINTMVGITNASVNIDKSVQPFYKYIIKRCNVNVGRAIPTSVCFGTKRLIVNIDDNTEEISFESCDSLVSVTSKCNDAVASVCIMPVDTDTIPVRYTFPGRGEILTAIMKLFPDLRSLVTVLWCVGNCLLDPLSRTKCIMLCGPGGSGKSTLLQLIYSCLAGCCGVLPDGALLGTSKAMSNDIAEVIASCRMAVCYDLDLSNHPLNMGIFKNVSGSDYVRVGFMSVKTNCSLLIGTNAVVDIDNQPEYLDDAILRRTCSILMNVNALDIPPSFIPEDSESRADLVCAALHTRLRYSSMPISPYDLLLSLCQSKIDTTLKYIEETDTEVDFFEALQVLDILSVILGKPADSIAFKAKLISPLAVSNFNGRLYIRNLRLTKSIKFAF